MKSAGIRSNIAVSCALALTVAFAPLARANEVVRVNADGSVTRIQTTVPAPSSNPAPLPGSTQKQVLGSATTVAPNNGTTVSNSTIVVGSGYYPGYSSYPAYPGYCPPAPGYYGTYSAPTTGYSMPLGRPTGGNMQPWVTGFGGTTTFGYYGAPAYGAPTCPPVYGAPVYRAPVCPPAYPACPPGYPGYTLPPMGYGYPTPPPVYPAYPATGAFTSGSITGSSSFSYRGGGFSATFGGGRGQSYTNSYTRGFTRHHGRR